MATINLRDVMANFTSTLATQMSAAAAAMTINRTLDDDGTTLASTYWITVDEGLSTEEHMIITYVGAAGTVVLRGLSRVDGNTEVAANKFAHDRGASVTITNMPLVVVMRLINGVDTFNSVDWLGVNSISGLATPAAGETTKAANVAYANALAIAGAPDATAAAKGIVEVATVAEASANAAAGSGSTSAALAVTTAITSNTSGAAQIIPVTDADGDIPVEFMELDAVWTFQNGVDVDTATNFKLGGVAYTGTMADMNESSDFFQATNATGAEMETLTDGSDAVGLHTHTGFGQVVEVSDTSVTVGNTTTEAPLMTVSVPANTLGSTGGIWVRMFINNHKQSDTRSIAIKVKYGATTIIQMDQTANSTFTANQGYIDINLSADGATNAQIAQMVFDTAASGSQWGNPAGSGVCMTSRTGTAVEDSTGALDFVVTADFDIAQAADTITMVGYIVYKALI